MPAVTGVYDPGIKRITRLYRHGDQLSRYQPDSLSTTVIVDVTAPTACRHNADGSVLTGTAEAGSTVTIRLADGSTVTTTCRQQWRLQLHLPQQADRRPDAADHGHRCGG